MINMINLSEEIVKLSTNYLGPAAKTFLERQTKVHMGGINFSDITKDKIPELSKWVNISAALLIDKEKANELSNKIATL